MRTTLSIAFLFGLCFLAGCSKIVVHKLVPSGTPPSISTADGVIYALPKTIVRVNLKVDKNSIKPAPFARYAGIFAPGISAVCKPKECKGVDDPGKDTFSVEDGASFTTYGEPDVNHVYLVKYSGSGAVDQNLALTWNESGLLSTASSTVTNRTTDVVVSGITSALSIAAKVVAAGGGAGAELKGSAKTAVGCKELIPSATTLSPKDKDFLDAIRSSSINVLLQPTMMRSYCTIPAKDRGDLTFDQPYFNAAVEAYNDQIVPLIVSLGTLFGGNSSSLSPTDLINKVTLEMNTRLIALYVGTKGTATWAATLDVRNVPESIDSEASKDLEIMKIDTDGVCISATRIAPDGAPLTSDFGAIKSSCDSGKPLTMHLAYLPEKSQQLATLVKEDDPETGDDASFRYRIPAQVSANLIYDDNSIAGGKFFVAQLGRVVALPATRHSKALTYNIGLIEATGGLKSFTLGTTGGLDSTTVSALGTAVTGIQDAKKTAADNAQAAADKAATAADPLTDLTRQDTILKLQDEICTIQQKYNLPCTVQPQTQK
jgi:hypothetical protein